MSDSSNMRFTNPVTSIVASDITGKTAYFEGDYVNNNNISVTAIHENGDRNKVSKRDYYIRPYKVEKEDTKLEVVYLNGKYFFDMPITVSEVVLDHITAGHSPSLYEYIIPSDKELEFDPRGITAYAHYNNGKFRSVPLRDLVITPPESLTTLGEAFYDISYTEGSITKTAIGKVLVRERRPVKIKVETLPTKTIYMGTEKTFDPSGLTFRIIYDNDTEEVVDYNNEMIEQPSDLSLTKPWYYAFKYSLKNNPKSYVEVRSYYKKGLLGKPFVTINNNIISFSLPCAYPALPTITSMDVIVMDGKKKVLDVNTTNYNLSSLFNAEEGRNYKVAIRCYADDYEKSLMSDFVDYSKTQESKLKPILSLPFANLITWKKDGGYDNATEEELANGFSIGDYVDVTINEKTYERIKVVDLDFAGICIGNLLYAEEDLAGLEQEDANKNCDFLFNLWSESCQLALLKGNYSESKSPTISITLNEKASASDAIKYAIPEKGGQEWVPPVPAVTTSQLTGMNGPTVSGCYPVSYDETPINVYSYYSTDSPGYDTGPAAREFYYSVKNRVYNNSFYEDSLKITATINGENVTLEGNFTQIPGDSYSGLLGNHNLCKELYNLNNTDDSKYAFRFGFKTYNTVYFLSKEDIGDSVTLTFHTPKLLSDGTVVEGCETSFDVTINRDNPSSYSFYPPRFFVSGNGVCAGAEIRSGLTKQITINNTPYDITFPNTYTNVYIGNTSLYGQISALNKAEIADANFCIHAYVEDNIPYIDARGNFNGELNVTDWNGSTVNLTLTGIEPGEPGYYKDVVTSFSKIAWEYVFYSTDVPLLDTTGNTTYYAVVNTIYGPLRLTKGEEQDDGGEKCVPFEASFSSNLPQHIGVGFCEYPDGGYDITLYKYPDYLNQGTIDIYDQDLTDKLEVQGRYFVEEGEEVTFNPGMVLPTFMGNPASLLLLTTDPPKKTVTKDDRTITINYFDASTSFSYDIIPSYSNISQKLVGGELPTVPYGDLIAPYIKFEGLNVETGKVEDIPAECFSISNGLNTIGLPLIRAYNDFSSEATNSWYLYIGSRKLEGISFAYKCSHSLDNPPATGLTPSDYWIGEWKLESDMLPANLELSADSVALKLGDDSIPAFYSVIADNVVEVRVPTDENDSMCFKFTKDGDSVSCILSALLGVSYEDPNMQIAREVHKAPATKIS